MSDFEKEYNEFIDDTNESSKKLRLILDDIGSSKYSYNSLKLSDISPVYSNNRIKIYIPKKKGKPTSNLF